MSKEKKLARLRERESGLMRIAEITDERIVFNNGNYICFAHEPDCCETNYADFEYLLDECCLFTTLFDENIILEVCNGGFRFGNKGKMFYVPCYSIQNGYYSTDIDIYYYKANNEYITSTNTTCEYKD